MSRCPFVIFAFSGLLFLVCGSLNTGQTGSVAVCSELLAHQAELPHRGLDHRIGGDRSRRSAILAAEMTKINPSHEGQPSSLLHPQLFYLCRRLVPTFPEHRNASVPHLRETSAEYELIDQRVLKAPERVETSILTLVDYLMAGTRNDAEKTRAIFRWITHNIKYGVNQLVAKEPRNAVAEEVLNRRQAVCDGYSGLFQAMSQAAGLEVVKISGWSKGYGYTVGDTFHGSPNHAWNAVKIDGTWCLLDCTWGAGYLNDSGVYVLEFTEHYFLTPPEKFVFDHLPEDSHWQLLDNSVSKKEFEKLPHLKSKFFEYGLSHESLSSHPRGTIESEGKLEVLLTLPENVCLTAKLIKLIESGSGHRRGGDLEETLSFVQKVSTEKSKVYGLFTNAGDYILRIYGKKRGPRGPHKWLLDYRINASQGMSGKIGFPKTYGAYFEHAVRLEKPMDLYLKAGATQFFRLVVPGADQVAVIMNDDWTYLDKDGDVFEGDVKIKKGTINVCAKFLKEQPFQGLLEYECVER